MDYKSRVQKSIDYIENKLDKPITLKELATQAFFSEFHYHRIFHALVGDSLMEYIRKRRLTLAAYDIKHSPQRILDIALKYQFGSQDTFTRAFKKQFGITPAKYRNSNNIINISPKACLSKKILWDKNGGADMQPEIIYKNEIKVIGIEEFTPKDEFHEALKHNLRNRKADRTAEQFFLNLKELVPNQVNPNIEICHNYDCPGGYMTLFCIEVSSLDIIPNGMKGVTIKSNKYAVFSHKFNLTPDKITIKELEEKICKYAFGTWLPSSQYELSDSYGIEFYDTSDISNNITTVNMYFPIRDK